MQPLNKKEMRHLASRAIAGDAKAFAILYEATSGAQYYKAFHILKNKALAEDAVQETYLRAFEKIGTLTEPRNFLAWLAQINYNCCMDIIKNKKRIVPSVSEDLALHLPDESDEETPEDNVLSKEMQKTVLGVMDSLTDEQRTLLLLRFYQGMKVRDIAHVIGCSEGTIKSRLHYTLKQMKRSLRQKGYSANSVWGWNSLFISAFEYEQAAEHIPGADSYSGIRNSRITSAAALSAMIVLAGSGLLLRPVGQSVISAHGEDTAAPTVESFFQLENGIDVYVQDDLSGVDLSSASIELSDGTQEKPAEILPEESRIRLPLPDENGYLFSIKDKAGNSSRYQLFPEGMEKAETD